MTVEMSNNFDCVQSLSSFKAKNEQKFRMCSIQAQEHMENLSTNENFAQINFLLLD